MNRSPGNSKPEPLPAKRTEVSSKTRFLDFPWGSKVGWPLREIGVHVTGIDYLQDHYLAGTDNSTTHLLYFSLSGKVEYNSGFGFEHLKAGSWALCPAGTPHWIRLKEGRAECLWLHLLDIPRWKFLCDQGPIICHINDPIILRSSLVNAITEASSNKYGAFENATSHASIFRIHLLREIDHACARTQDPMISRLSKLWSQVSSRLAEEWTVERLATEIHISRTSLYEHMARIHQINPMGMVTKLRMEHAKDLLLHGDDTLESIATTVGYKTPYAFSQSFLREVGLRPGAYRKTRWI